MGKEHGGKLTDEHRDFLVRELACYATPKEAADSLKEQYGVEITPQATETYDPNKKAGAKLSKKWREIFETARKAFLDHVGERVPEANKAVRVNGLAHAARALRTSKNWLGMKDMYEAIAKEMGNVHTNKREYSGPGGKPMQHEVKDVSELTADQVNDELRAAMKDPATRAMLLSLGLADTKDG